MAPDDALASTVSIQTAPRGCDSGVRPTSPSSQRLHHHPVMAMRVLSLARSRSATAACLPSSCTHLSASSTARHAFSTAERRPEASLSPLVILQENRAAGLEDDGGATGGGGGATRGRGCGWEEAAAGGGAAAAPAGRDQVTDLAFLPGLLLLAPEADPGRPCGAGERPDGFCAGLVVLRAGPVGLHAGMVGFHAGPDGLHAGLAAPSRVLRPLAERRLNLVSMTMYSSSLSALLPALAALAGLCRRLCRPWAVLAGAGARPTESLARRIASVAAFLAMASVSSGESVGSGGL